MYVYYLLLYTYDVNYSDYFQFLKMYNRFFFSKLTKKMEQSVVHSILD